MLQWSGCSRCVAGSSVAVKPYCKRLLSRLCCLACASRDKKKKKKKVGSISATDCKRSWFATPPSGYVVVNVGKNRDRASQPLVVMMMEARTGGARNTSPIRVRSGFIFIMLNGHFPNLNTNAPGLSWLRNANEFKYQIQISAAR